MASLLKIQALFPRMLILGVVILLVAALSVCGSGGGQTKTIVLYGFSIMEDVLKEAIIPAFQEDWEERTGESIKFVTSFAGSGTITNQMIFGAPAQIAMLATELDALRIKDAGFVVTDWRSFPSEGTYAYTITCVATRESNPKDIHSFEDLTKSGVEVLYPDPTTSGGAQWAILALYGAALRMTEAATGTPDQAYARDLLMRVSSNVSSLPESARRALTQFSLGYGDALLTYENEALHDISSGEEYEIVVPESTIYVEPKVVIVDKNVAESEKDVVRAFVAFLWTEEAQEAFARYNFRVVNEVLSEKYATVELPFTVDYLGGWEEATSTIIDQIWKQVQREIK